MKKVEHPKELLINSIIEFAIPTLSHLLKRNGIEKIHLGNSNENFNSDGHTIRNDGVIIFYEQDINDYTLANNYINSKRVLKESYPKDFFELNNKFSTYQLMNFSERIKKLIEDLIHLENSALSSVNYFKEINIDCHEKKILIELNNN